MATITFGGIAPISSGTHVRLLVDNPDNPTRAISIDDLDHKVSYVSEATPYSVVKGIPNYIMATVVSTKVYAKANQTELTV